MLSKKSISSNITIVALILLLIFLANIKYKQWKNQKAIEVQKENILAQTNALNKKSNELNESLEYLNSVAFKERVAREQLNLKKEGETVYTFGNPGEQISETLNSNKKISNFEKWWTYFFN